MAEEAVGAEEVEGSEAAAEEGGMTEEVDLAGEEGVIEETATTAGEVEEGIVVGGMMGTAMEVAVGEEGAIHGEWLCGVSTGGWDHGFSRISNI